MITERFTLSTTTAQFHAHLNNLDAMGYLPYRSYIGWDMEGFTCLRFDGKTIGRSVFAAPLHFNTFAEFSAYHGATTLLASSKVVATPLVTGQTAVLDALIRAVETSDWDVIEVLSRAYQRLAV